MRRPRARQRHAVTQWPAPRSPHHTLPLRRTLLLLRVVQLILRKRCRRHGDSTWRCAATVSLRAYCTPEGRPGPHSGSRHAPTPLHAQTQAQFCPTGLPVGRLPAATPHDRSCRLRTRPRGPSRCWFQANRSHTGGQTAASVHPTPRCNTGETASAAHNGRPAVHSCPHLAVNAVSHCVQRSAYHGASDGATSLVSTHQRPGDRRA